MRMEPPAPALHERDLPLRTARHGFALIIALALMAFLLLLMLSLSTLISVETQSSSTLKQRDYARQNALLALQIAIGTLQQNAGPDQRITATSGILDTRPKTGAIDGVTESYWTGVWDSDGQLLSWLVSGNEGLAPTDPDFHSPSSPNAGYVSMLAAGSVSVPAVSLDDGRYAYWISDEGTKAKITLPDTQSGLQSLATARKIDITQIDDLAWTDAIAPEVRERTITTDSLQFFAQGRQRVSFAQDPPARPDQRQHGAADKYTRRRTQAGLDPGPV